MKRILIAALFTAALAAQTTVTVSPTVQTTNVQRLGVNLGAWNYYDGSQNLKNLLSNNPGFEGQVYNSVEPCNAVANPHDCQNGPSGGNTSYNYDEWPNNWWAGATYRVLTGPNAGHTGTITASTTASNSYSQTDFTLSGTDGAQGEYIAISKTIASLSVPGTLATGGASTPVEGWWVSDQIGTSSVTAETADIHQGSPGKQAALVTAAGGGIGLSACFDSTAGANFTLLNGAYQIQFWAKALTTGAQVQVAVGRAKCPQTGTSGSYWSQTVSVSNSWQQYTYTFNASETNPASGVAYAKWIVSNGNIEIDDVSLTKSGGNSSNTTVFRDSLVNTLKALRPGVLRNWGQVPNLGDTFDNSIALSGARKSAHYSGPNFGPVNQNYGLNEFLALCSLVGADPWIVISDTYAATDVQHLMEYLAGASTTPYGSIRAQQGQTAPWTSVFNTIHIELGNENWNAHTFSGGVVDDYTQYARLSDVLFGAIKASPYYTQSPSQFQLILGTQFVSTYQTSLITSTATKFDAIAIAPYTAYDLTSSCSTNECMFGNLYGEIYNDSHGSGVGGNNDTYDQKKFLGSIPLVVYEDNLSPSSGNASQAQINSFVPSLGSGIATVEQMLMQARDNGVTVQNIFELGQYIEDSNNWTVPLWGIAPNIDNTGVTRPTFLAAEIANLAIGSSGPVNLVTATPSPSTPTWTQNVDFYGSTVPNVKSPYIDAYAFSNGSIILFNLDRSRPQPVQLGGSGLPSGSVSQYQLTSTNITDNNESQIISGGTPTVQTSATCLTNFNPSVGLTLPAFSMTALVPSISCSTSPDFSLSASPASQTVTAGGASGAYTVTVGASNGFTGTVTLSASNLPAGTTATFNPASINSAGNSALTLQTSSATPAGTYTVTVTGISGSLQHTAAVSLVVTAQTPPAISSVTAANVTSTSATITWTTDQASTSQVEYGTATSYGSTSPLNSSLVTSHSVNLTGLTAGITYDYAALSSNAAGLQATSTNFTFTTSSGSNPTLLAYEPFGEASGTPLQGASGSGDSGWASAWVEQYGSVTLPGYEAVSTTPMSFSGLQTAGNHGIGGFSYQSVGRQLNVAAGGPFSSYLSNGLIGASGQTIWLSFLLREDANPSNGQVNAIYLTASGAGNQWLTQTGIGVGYFGGSPYWGLQFNNGTPMLSNVAVVQGQTVLLVVSVTFGAANQVNLYVNPTSLGGAAPTMPSAQLSTASSAAFQSFSYLGGYGTNDSSLDEIRFGSTYAAVTPSSGTLLASELFGEASGTPLQGASGSGDSGWGAAWVEQSGSTAVPGYEVASTSPLTYSGLTTPTRYAIGGYSYQSAGRQLNVSPAGPFGSYLVNGLVGAPGQTVWLSFLLREDANPSNGQINAIYLTPSTAAWQPQTGIGVGYFGGSAYWGLQWNNGTPMLSTLPVVQGQTALMVVSITFGSTNQVNLYVNPTSLGGTAPTTPSVQFSTSSSAAFQSFSYLGGYGANSSSLADIRFGTSFAAVTR